VDAADDHLQFAPGVTTQAGQPDAYKLTQPWGDFVLQPMDEQFFRAKKSDQTRAGVYPLRKFPEKF